MKSALQRTVQLGLLAKDLARVRARPEGVLRDQVLQQLVDRLGLMHGLPQKIGQLLSFSEFGDAAPMFTRLTEDAATLRWDEVIRCIEAGIQQPWKSCFESIEPAGIGASLGQVHRARLHDGRVVAVKVQYPGIHEKVRFDLGSLGWLTAPIGDLRRGFDIQAYRHEVGGMLERELDYRQEASSMKQFAAWIKDWADIQVPEVVDSLSSERILVSTWLEGERMASAIHWPDEQRQVLARTLLKLFCRGLFQWGALHADPHPGNYRFTREHGKPRIGLLDFGCVKQISPGLSAGLKRLLRAASEQFLGDADELWKAYLEMGFQESLLAPMRPKLVELTEVLLTPVMTRGNFCTRSWNLRGRFAEVLGPHRVAFRLAGPPDMIFFLRAFHGLASYLAALEGQVDWGEILADEGAFHGGAQEGRQGRVGAEMRTRKTCASKSLRIRVVEGGVTRVELIFDPEAVDHLEEIVPIELRDRLRERSVDLAAISQEARRRNYAPGELFKIVEGAKTVRVWLD